MAQEFIQSLLLPSVQKFIEDHEHEDVASLLLKKSAIEGIPAGVIAEQIRGRAKAKIKLPLFYNTKGIVYPPGVNLEQCSSEATAKFKSTLVKPGKKFLDLTGGYGVDTFFLSKLFEDATYVEPNQQLVEIVKHNHAQLGNSNIQYENCLAEEFLSKNSNYFDLVFIDPSRRSTTQQKVFKLADCIPDLSSLQDSIYERTEALLVKTSPLLDIRQGLKELKFVQKVVVLSIENECKEVLFVCQKGFESEPQIDAINILKEDLMDSFSFTFSQEQNTTASLSRPLDFLYEPNASILKSGAFKSIGDRYHLKKIHQHTHLYTSNDLRSDFPGRIFKIEAFVKGDRNELLKYFPEGKANITTRNYPLSVEDLRKKTKLKAGGDKFLFGFSGDTKKYLVVASRIK